MKSTIIFVYNADKELFDSLLNSTHKISSPSIYQCNLYYLTYTALGMRREWKQFLGTFKVPVEFWHRDEFKEEYSMDDVKLPAVFVKEGDNPELRIDADSINHCKSINDLKVLIHGKLFDVFNNKPVVYTF